MAGVVNNCRHCGSDLWDEETAQDTCSNCGKKDWNEMRAKPVPSQFKTPLTTEELLLIQQHRNGNCQKGIHTIRSDEAPNGRCYTYCCNCEWVKLQELDTSC